MELGIGNDGGDGQVRMDESTVFMVSVTSTEVLKGRNKKSF